MDHRTCTPQTSSCIPSTHNQPTLTGAFEDYRYDALGRRVQVRTRTDSICEGSSCTSSLMWVVWDGSQIAAELRVPGGDGLSGDSLETGCGCGPMYGSVEYLNGPTFDQPLEIQGILVHRTWRGLIDGGDCLPASCTSPTSDYTGLTYEAYLGVMPSFQHAPTSWHGSLFAEGVDDAGLMYRRNRYYDPATGQFTQEDPLGLAGGMNAYGYANGDPVNYDDPFGLCIEDACIGEAAIAVAAIEEGPVIGASLAGAGASLEQAGGTILHAFSTMGSTLAGSERLVSSALSHTAQESAATLGKSWTTQRRTFWKVESSVEQAAERWGSANAERMKKGLAPQIDGKSVELHHTPVAKRHAGTKVVPVTPAQHAQQDPFRHTGDQ